MAADKDVSSPSLLLPNLGVLLLVAAGLLADKIPLISGRPAAEDGAPPIGETMTRLWQDPLGVKEPAELKLSTIRPLEKILVTAVEEKRRSHEQTLPPNHPLPVYPKPRVLVLPVLLPGTPYAADKELRLRSRYAVLSALGRAQYVSEDSDHLKFVKIAMSDDTTEVVRLEDFHVRYLVTDDVHMPGNENYADYQRPADPTHALTIKEAYDWVIVLWLDEDHLSERAAREARYPSVPGQIDRLVAQLMCDPQRTERLDWDLTVIGPNSSDQLVAMISPNVEFHPQLEAKVLSPRASAANEALRISNTRAPNPNSVDPEYVHSAKEGRRWSIRRSIATDERLRNRILDELRLRGVKPSDAHPMALVGEWDTLYSRALGRGFAAHLNTTTNDPINPRGSWAATPSFFREFSYLRGLDGESPAKKKKESSDAPPSGSASKEKSGPSSFGESTADLERAAGPSQYDYLRRLEKRLLIWQGEIGARAGSERGEIGSIGVVGSDTYDKLLVLRALRKSFPRAVFFTTDLDASYFNREELDHTRNLIVASSYDLVADWKLQGRIPPFRDSYQTALFVTVLDALGTRVGTPEHSFPVPGKSETIVPRLFEIGRNGYIDLTALDAPEAVSARWVKHKGDGERLLQLPSRWFGIPLIALAVGALLWYWLANHRPNSDTNFNKIPLPSLDSCVAEFTWIFLLLLGLVINVAFFHLSDEKPPGYYLAAAAVLYSLALYVLIITFEWHRKKARGPLVDFLLVLPAAAMLVALFFRPWRLLITPVLLGRDEEPFVWFQGVSIWPTEIVRVLSIVLCIGFLIYCQRRLVGLKPWLHKKLAANRDPATEHLPAIVGSLPPLPRRFFSGWNRRFWPLSLGENNTGREVALLDRYCSALSGSKRIFRIYVAMGLYLAIFLPLFEAFGQPIVPARGVWSRALDQGILAASVVSYCFLLFFVLDALLLCAVLIRQLRNFIGELSAVHERGTMELINDLTDEVSRLVYLPFSILFMLIAARNPLFDNWDWPAVLIAVFASGLILIFVAAGLLQHQAKEARQQALDHLDARVLVCTYIANPTPREKADAEWFKEQRAQIRALDGVIFKPWYQNPIYRAMLIPLGGIGSLQLLEKASGFFQ